ncbi:MAG: hypothetical protein WEF50_19935 [Myxococcota bacterium]
MAKLETGIVTGVRAADSSEAEIAAEFRALLAAGARIRCAGEAKSDPLGGLSRRYPARHKLVLFDTTFYLAHLRQDVNARFFVSYVMLDSAKPVAPGRRTLHARILYKDASLIWRSASHFARSDAENWIGKGDLKWVREHGKRVRYTAEETTNLPFEIQAPLDALTRALPSPKRDERAMARVLRRAPDQRVAPYDDFVAPRRKAVADKRNRIHGGKRVAWFARAHDPGSLRFARGYEPDFAGGILEVYAIGSRLYGGEIRKFRVLSSNRRIQYQFVAAPRQVWMVPPQALTRELSSFGVRTIDVNADDDLFVPGYEYHFMDDSEDPPVLYSQIPPGFAGGTSEVDPARADASPWNERLSVLQEFRKAIGHPRPEGAK